MSTANTLEIKAVKEKLLQVLRNNNMGKVLDYTQFLISSLGKMGDIIEKVHKVLDEAAIEKTIYSDVEWAAAYVIAHEYKTIEELIMIREVSLAKQKYNDRLAKHITNAIHDLNIIKDELIKQIRENTDENIYNAMTEILEKTNSIIRYLLDIWGKIQKDNRELIDYASAAEEKIEKTVIRILEEL
jgi:hypothetical protein